MKKSFTQPFILCMDSSVNIFLFQSIPQFNFFIFRGNYAHLKHVLIFYVKKKLRLTNVGENNIFRCFLRNCYCYILLQILQILKRSSSILVYIWCLNIFAHKTCIELGWRMKWAQWRLEEDIRAKKESKGKGNIFSAIPRKDVHLPDLQLLAMGRT